MLLVMVFSIFFVPETKGKSLEEIQNYFKRKVEKHETPDGNFTFDVEEEIVYWQLQIQYLNTVNSEFNSIWILCVILVHKILNPLNC